MKLTVTPDDGEPAESLAALGALIERAHEQVRADPREPDPGAVRARVKLSLSGQRVRAVELSW